MRHYPTAASVVLIGLLATPLAQGQERAGLRLLDRASQLLDAGDAAAAERDAAVFVEQFAGSDLIDEGLLLLAQAQAANLDPDAARATVTHLTTGFPRTASAASAMVLVAGLDSGVAGSPEELRQIRERLERLPLLYSAEEFPRLEARPAATVLAGEISLRLGERERAGALFAQATATAEKEPWRARALRGLGLALLREGEWAAAAGFLQQAVGESAEARSLLTLIHRHEIGSSASPWSHARLATTWGRALDRPVGIAVSTEDEIFVVDEGTHVGLRTDSAGALVAVRDQLAAAVRPWFDPNGQAHVVAQGSLLTPFARQRETFSVPDGNEVREAEDLVAVARGPFGDVLVAYDGGQRVARFDAAGRFDGFPLGTQRMRVSDVVLDPSGGFLLLDRSGKQVFRLSPEGAVEVWLRSEGWRRPEALAIDALGNTYVLDRDAKRIDVFGRDRRLRHQLGPQMPGGLALGEPRDLAVDRRGRLLVADRGRRGVLVIE